MRTDLIVYFPNGNVLPRKQLLAAISSIKFCGVRQQFNQCKFKTRVLRTGRLFVEHEPKRVEYCYINRTGWRPLQATTYRGYEDLPFPSTRDYCKELYTVTHYISTLCHWELSLLAQAANKINSNYLFKTRIINYKTELIHAATNTTLYTHTP